MNNFSNAKHWSTVNFSVNIQCAPTLSFAQENFILMRNNLEHQDDTNESAIFDLWVSEFVLMIWSFPQKDPNSTKDIENYGGKCP